MLFFIFLMGSYRSANLGGSPACLRQVAVTEKVLTIVNLNNEDIGNNLVLSSKEERQFSSYGGEVYVHLLNMPLYAQTNPSSTYKQISQVIRVIQDVDGPVLIHCILGSHDTGAIFGIMQKCFNHQSISEVLAETRCHATLTSSKLVTDLANIEAIIKNFPCDLLNDFKGR